MGRSIIIAAVFMMIASCNPSRERVLYEAASIHNESIQISRPVEDRLKAIDSRLAVAAEQSFSELHDSLKILQQDFIDWKTMVVEVPGNEHHDHHDHSHHDNGAFAPEITPEMLLQIQNQIQEIIKDLDQRSQQVLDQLKE